MGWRAAEFNGKQVWAEVGTDGQPIAEKGLVRIRYSRTPGAKIYSGGMAKLRIDANANVEELATAEGSAMSDSSGTRSSQRAHPTTGTTSDGGSNGGRGRPQRTGRSHASGFGSAGSRTMAQAAMAQDAAEKLIASLGDAVLAFTDGACRGNPGPAGSGAALRNLPGKKQLSASVSLGRGTNNIAELAAVGLALDLLVEAGVPRDAKVALFTDSAYVHGVLIKNWKAKANQVLIHDLRTRLKAHPNLTIYWIAGHVGIEGNERADELAREGVEGVTARYRA